MVNTLIIGHQYGCNGYIATNWTLSLLIRYFEVHWKTDCTSFDYEWFELKCRLRFSISLRCNYKNNQYLTCAKSDRNHEIQISRQNNQVQHDPPRTPRTPPVDPPRSKVMNILNYSKMWQNKKNETNQFLKNFLILKFLRFAHEKFKKSFAWVWFKIQFLIRIPMVVSSQSFSPCFKYFW